MTGFLLPPASRGTRRSCSRSRKRQTRRRRNPSSFVASCPTLLPFACVPGASPTTLAFSPVVLTGPSTDGIPFALSLQRVPFVLPSPQVASLPLGHAWGSGGYHFPVFFIPVGLTPKY
uniref:Small EDRK-rich factor 2 n=5 Tax=Canis lupus TaxID=9612 RepID=A0A8C0QB58_CANLF